MFERKDALVLDFTGVYARIGSEPWAGTLDFSSLPGTSCYLDPDSEAVISARLAPFLTSGRRGRSRPSGISGGAQVPPGSDGAPLLHFLDCGDYHYLSSLLAAGISEPFDLVLIDNHPDTQEPSFGGLVSCGGWVRDMLEKHPFLRNVRMYGIGRDHLPGPEQFPGRISFPGTPETGYSPDGLPVYVSIDLDALSEEYARTDWDQGCLAPEDVEAILAPYLAVPGNLLGVDICGGNPPSKGGTPEDARLNEALALRFANLVRAALS